jgi:ABC-type transporter Mla subunit MlaD
VSGPASCATSGPGLDHLPALHREMTQVATVPRSAAEHYRDAERLLASAEALIDVTENAAPAIAVLAVCHATLSTAPRRARKRPAQHGGSNLPRTMNWEGE